MDRNKRTALGAGVLVLTLAAGIGVATAAGASGGDDDRPIPGDALGRASAVALEHVGEGRVTETEIGDEDSYYEVEVTRADGSQVDVQLDESFTVVSSAGDDGSGDDGAGDDGDED